MNTSLSDHFPHVMLNAPDGARAKVYVHGGHIVSWATPDGRERLFLSGRSEFRPSAAIRGGVPVIFPQFAGMGPLPKHGFARVLPWQHQGTETDEASVTVHFALVDSDETRRMWDHRFLLDLTVRVGGPTLEMRLQVTNPGLDSFDFTAALHTYLYVSDIAGVLVEGLEGLTYQQFGVEGEQEEARLHIAGEVDRIYRNVQGPIILRDGEHTLRLTADGFPDAVVWNPGPEKAASLADLDSYQHMLCIEAAVIGQAISLNSGSMWQGRQTIEVL